MKVAVIGAGLAGLAAACDLSDLGHDVTLFERRRWAGGKTYSFVDRPTGDVVDNGQHVFMACTTAYAGFLWRLGTLKRTHRQRRLHVPVFDAAGRRSDIFASPFPAPFHLALSFIGYRHLSLRAKFQVARALASVARLDPAGNEDLSRLTFGAWLREHRFDGDAVRGFFDFMLVPTLNCRSDEASAEAAIFVLQTGFLHSPRASALRVSGIGLSDLHVAPAIQYLERNGASIRLGTGVEAIDTAGDGSLGVRLEDGGRERFDACVCAVPHTRAAALLPPAAVDGPLRQTLASLPVSPIINLHIWFDRAVTSVPFAAFTGSDLQWVFSRRRLDFDQSGTGEHLVVSLSAARRFMDMDKAELEHHFLPQLRRALPGARAARVVRFTAMKEPEATFIPAPGIHRPGPETQLRNVVLAGAYTDTGWPATMESAVRSGHAAAQLLISRAAEFRSTASHLPAGAGIP